MRDSGTTDLVHDLLEDVSTLRSTLATMQDAQRSSTASGTSPAKSELAAIPLTHIAFVGLMVVLSACAIVVVQRRFK